MLRGGEEGGEGERRGGGNLQSPCRTAAAVRMEQARDMLSEDRAYAMSPQPLLVSCFSD